MVEQKRNEAGRFAPKSDQPRRVRTMRLTDVAWNKLGEIADSQNLNRADFIERWLQKEIEKPLGEQLKIFEQPEEIITKDTRKTGAQLAKRLDVTSGAVTNWWRNGDLRSKSKKHDPNKYSWDRNQGSRLYHPVFE